MKKIFLSLLLIGLMSGTAMASNDGGKKKTKKKAKTEQKKQLTNCDPKNCDPKNCDPKCCDLSSCSKEEKCTPTPSCSGKQ